MKIGAVFPQTEIGEDVIIIRDYVQAVEELGFDYLLAFDHLLGANPDRPGGWTGPYDYTNTFYEPFVLFSHLAAITHKIEFATGIIILPQRQTALVAKQAADLDRLSDGRLRFGIGVGWNKVEYEALNEDFTNRGKRQAEQVKILRKLWTQPLVTYNGHYHTISDAGINPLPVQRPIPIWFGGGSDIVLRRMAKLGDGWISPSYPSDKLAQLLKTLHGYMDDEGRDPSTFGVDYHILLDDKTPDQLASEFETLQGLGVTHICLYTMGQGLTPQGHIDALKMFKSAVSSV